MAPEQLEAKEVDARADIFAFGAVLYEVITGRKAFEETSQARLISAILSSEPLAISVLQPLTPPALDRVIRTVWRKTATTGGQASMTSCCSCTGSPGWIGRCGSRRRRAGTAAAICSHGRSRPWPRSRPRCSGLELRHPTPDVRTQVFSVLPPPGVSLATDEAPAISPDGRRLLFVGHDATGKQLLYTRALDVASPRSRWRTPMAPRCPSGHPTANRPDSLPKAGSRGLTWERNKSRRWLTPGAPEAAPGTRTMSSCSCHVPVPVCTAFLLRGARPRL